MIPLGKTPGGGVMIGVWGVVNSSLREGLVPPAFKKVMVTASSSGHQLTQLHNFHPLSNLSYLEKILEKTIIMQLQRTLAKKMGLSGPLSVGI